MKVYESSAPNQASVKTKWGQSFVLCFQQQFNLARGWQRRHSPMTTTTTTITKTLLYSLMTDAPTLSSATGWKTAPWAQMKPSAVSRHTQPALVCRRLHFCLGWCSWRLWWCILPSEVRKEQQPASQDISRWPLSAGVLQRVGPELGQRDLCHAGIQKVRFAANLDSDGAVFVSISPSSFVDRMSVISAPCLSSQWVSVVSQPANFAHHYLILLLKSSLLWSHDSSKPLSALTGSKLPIRFSPRLLLV